MTALSVLEARRVALLASTPTATLVETVLALEGSTFGSDERRALAWACDELERRFPAVDPVMDAWVEADEDGRSYGQVLVAALRDLGAAS